jgi:hypothetical protein
MKNAIFWDVSPPSSGLWIIFTLMIEAAHSFETSVLTGVTSQKAALLKIVPFGRYNIGQEIKWHF